MSHAPIVLLCTYEMILMHLLIFSIIIVNVLNSNISVVNKLADYVNLIADITNFYEAGSIYILHGDSHEKLISGLILLNFLKKFSSLGLFSQTMHQSDFYEKYNDTFKSNRRELIVLFLENEEHVENFQDFTESHRLYNHAWFVIFWKQELDHFCENPKLNRFHLQLNIRMVVKCFGSSVIREWNAVNRKCDVSTTDIFEWDRKNRLVKKTGSNFYQRHHNFYGMPLTVSTIKELRDIKNLQNGNVIDHIMTELMMTHLNFSINFVPPYETYGRCDPKTNKWSGLLGGLSAGNFNMSFSEFTITAQRYKDFDFTWPLYVTPNALYIRAPGIVSVKWNAYTKAFDRRIWRWIIISMVIATIIISIIKIKAKNPNTSNSVFENFLYILGIYCQQGLAEFPKVSSLRIAYVSLFFASVVITAAYSGSIVSNLTNLIETLPFNSFSDFIKLGTYKLAVLRDSVDEDYFYNPTTSDVAQMRTMMKPHNTLPPNNLAGLKQICIERVAFYTNEMMKLKEAKRIPCKVAGIYPGGKRYLGIPLPKNSPLTKMINYHIRRFEEYGLTKRMKNKFVERNEYSITKYYPVGFREITPVLSALGGALVISFIILLLECITCGAKHIFNNTINIRIDPD